MKTIHAKARHSARLFLAALLIGLGWGPTPSFATVSEPLGDVYVAPAPLQRPWVRVTVYRNESSAALGAARLEVNGRYHTSLQAGAYTDLCLPPGGVELGVRWVQTGVDPDRFAPGTLALQLQASQPRFVSVSKRSDGRVEVLTVDARVAEQEIKVTRRQKHAVSRVVQDAECSVDPSPVASTVAASALPPPASNAAEPVLDTSTEVLVLGAGTLFAFGDAALVEGSSLASLVERLKAKAEQGEVMHIHITGHADPLGQSQGNQAVSDARAAVVRRHLLQQGVKAQRISSEGVGAEQLLRRGCDTRITPESIECNQPNRRVVVSVQTFAP